MRTYLVIALILLFAGNALAFDAEFFRDYKNSELRIDYVAGYANETDIYITDVDYENDLLIGMTNAGKVWIPVASITQVTKLSNNQQAVHNHYQY